MQYQLEHHLFPAMPRYKYPALMPQVKKFAEDNNLDLRITDEWELLKLNVDNYRRVATLESEPGKSQYKQPAIIAWPSSSSCRNCRMYIYLFSQVSYVHVCQAHVDVVGIYVGSDEFAHYAGAKGSRPESRKGDITRLMHVRIFLICGVVHLSYTVIIFLGVRF